MEKTRPILYGVSDYAEIRKANAWFIDRTAKIRDLEGTRYALFLRPRRFGKSLLTSLLESYYDVRYADRFDFFFKGTDIGANPTDERGKYLILKFDFSEVPVLVGSFALGPFYAVIIELLKNLIHLPVSSTATLILHSQRFFS